MQVVVDSLLTHYEMHGKGKTILLLHGWGDSSASFKQLGAELAKHYHVIALDLPGFGATETPQEVWGVDNYAYFVDHFLSKIRAEKLYCILGHSNGGAIAVRALARGWLSADKLVLLASAGIRGQNPGRLKALKLVTKAGKALASPLPKSVKHKLRKKLYGAVGSDMLVAENLEETFKRVVADDVQADAARLRIPALIIYGDKDEATPITYGKTFNELIPGSKLEIVTGAGHFVHQENLDAVAKLLKDFLK